MIIKTRPISKHRLDALIHLSESIEGACLKDMLAEKENFRRLAAGITSGNWEARIISVMDYRRYDSRPLADDNPETKYVATVEVEEEFTLLIGSCSYGKHSTPRTFINAVLDCCGLFPVSLY